MPDYLLRIKESIINETGGSEEALKERSAIFHTRNVPSKTLILVGEFDDRRTLPSAVALHEKLTMEGKDSHLKIYPNEIHILSANKWDAIFPFVRQHFFDVLRMPVHEFRSLVLGKKGTAIRLHVQHFDQIYEDVVVKRSSF